MSRAISRAALNLNIAHTAPHTIGSARQTHYRRETLLATKFLLYVFADEWVALKHVLIDPVFGVVGPGNIGMNVCGVSRPGI